MKALAMFLKHFRFAMLLAVIALLFAAIAVVSLRSNNLQMIALREAVFEADKNNSPDLNKKLETLRAYVNTHMHTDLSGGNATLKLPVQLTYSFQRAKDAESKAVAEKNAQVNLTAQTYCENTIPSGFSGRGRVGCIEEYVATNGVKEKAITEDEYKYNFVSPTWSADKAGLSMIAAFFFAFLAALMFIVQLMGRSHRRRHYN